MEEELTSGANSPSWYSSDCSWRSEVRPESLGSFKKSWGLPELFFLAERNSIDAQIFKR